MANVYRYTFDDCVALEEIEATLVLTIMAAESLHGQAQVRLDGRHFLDRGQRALVIDAGSPVGRDINRLFTGYAAREFGQDAFQVKQVDRPVSQPVGRNGR